MYYWARRLFLFGTAAVNINLSTYLDGMFHEGIGGVRVAVSRLIQKSFHKTVQKTSEIVRKLGESAKRSDAVF